ncbi:MAG: hypothetical protein KJ710_06680 [Candidatus Omnitrophica bacterium]|nr:hypothetical protein [Candidatus Omnitrophota bacterium]
MNIIILAISSVVLLALLIVHSYASKGIRTTVIFFLLAFTMMFYKEFILHFSVSSPVQNFVFLIKNTPVAVNSMAVVAGWMITFYLSWYFAERILLRFDNFKKRLFTMLVCGLVVTISICYCLENLGVGMGWWTWRFHTPGIERFLMDCDKNAIGGWTRWSFIFLLTFFLIECSRYRSAKWKGAFLLIPVTLLAGYRYHFGFYQYAKVLYFAVLNTFFFCFSSPLQMDYITGHFIKLNSKLLKYINQIPLIVLLFMLLFVAISEVFVLKYPALLISTIPLLMIILLSIKELPLFFIVIFSGAISIILKEKMFISFMPVIFVVLLWGAERAIKKAHISKRILLILGIIIYLSFSYLSVILIEKTNQLKLAPTIVMSAYKGPVVTISGNIVFNDYKDGFIDMRVFVLDPVQDRISPRFSSKEERKGNKNSKKPNLYKITITKKRLEKPGFYKIEVPKNMGEVYIEALNLIKKNGPGIILGKGEYIKNPFRVDTQDVRSVDIAITGRRIKPSNIFSEGDTK